MYWRFSKFSIKVLSNNPDWDAVSGNIAIWWERSRPTVDSAVPRQKALGWIIKVTEQAREESQLAAFLHGLLFQFCSQVPNFPQWWILNWKLKEEIKVFLPVLLGIKLVYHTNRKLTETSWYPECGGAVKKLTVRLLCLGVFCRGKMEDFYWAFLRVFGRG